MKRIILALLSIGLLSAAPATTFLRKNSLKISTTDTDLMIDGRVRQEYFFLNNPATLRSDANDSYHFFRNKVNLGFAAQTGKRTFGEPSVDGLIRLTAFNYWDRPLKYTPLTEERINFNNHEVHKQASITDDHTHEGVVPLLYLEEAWLRLNLDLLFEPFVELPVSLKMGYFPYQLGRGVTLGDYFDGAVPHLGWAAGGGAGNATNYPAGMLFDIELTDFLAIEFYFSKMRALATSPADTREAIFTNRLDVFPHNADRSEIERGLGRDTNIYSLKGDINLNLKKQGMFHIEPYLLFVNAPELCIEKTADASAYLNTIGLMSEFSNQQLTINLESAMQWGQYQVHAIDRNELVVDAANYNTGNLGIVGTYYSHIVNPDGVTTAMRGKDLDSVVYQPINRSIDKNGAGITDGTSQLSDAIRGTNLKNASLPFAAGARFRKGYNVDTLSAMGMIDVKYQINRKVGLAACAAYISGDHYPFNTEENSNYHGFIPFRDQNYLGHSVRSFALLYARKIPRPTDFVDTRLYAHNFAESMANIAYIGLGATLTPLNNPKELILLPSLIAFWQPQPPYEWSATTDRSFVDPVDTATYKAVQEKLNFTGSALRSHANSMLGFEANITMIWNILENLDIVAIGALFVPGKLYRDVDGMPNRNTRRQDLYGNAYYESLGKESVWGGNIRFTYRF